jgi:hypothetical protein
MIDLPPPPPAIIVTVDCREGDAEAFLIGAGLDVITSTGEVVSVQPYQKPHKRRPKRPQQAPETPEPNEAPRTWVAARTRSGAPVGVPGL